jgi:hypothetical protein
VDSAYQAKYLSMARLLWEASQGNPQDIPVNYSEHLAHNYIDGDISLVPLLTKFESFSELEDYEVEEAIEMLGKVSPEDWPEVEDIEGVSVEELLRIYDEDATDPEGFNFVEDNLSTAEKVEKCLIEVISSVFGDKVSSIRSEKGYFPNPKNNFLQEDDGTFAGTFMFDGNKFLFEVAPAEDGWICTYRMHWDSVDKLPPYQDEENPEKTDYTRRVRHRGWN